MRPQCPWCKRDDFPNWSAAKLHVKFCTKAPRPRSSTKSSRPKKRLAGVCRVCRCTDQKPCLTLFGPCAWANPSRTLCTACESLRKGSGRGKRR